MKETGRIAAGRRTGEGSLSYMGRFLLRAALLALLWLTLTDGAAAFSPIGLGVVLVAAAWSFVLVPGPIGLLRRPIAVLRLLGFFLYFAAWGGIDVARRALAPSRPVRPGWIRHGLRVPAGPATILFMAIVSLLPGTVSVRLEGRTLLVHALSLDLPVGPTLERLEERILALRPRAGHPMQGS